MRTAIPSHPRSSDVTDWTPPLVTPTLWATHPTVAANPNEGHNVRALHHDAATGTLLVGYGDWTTNTGPVDLLGIDVSTASPVTLFTGAQTESLEVFREIGGDLYSPWIDTKGGAPSDGSGGFVTNAGGSWHEVVVPGYIHVFDVQSTDGSDLIVLGAHGSTAGIHRSIDGGATWADITPPGNFGIRFYYGVTGGGWLYLPEGWRWSAATGWEQYTRVGTTSKVELHPNNPALSGWTFVKGIAVSDATGDVVESLWLARPECVAGGHAYGTRWVGDELWVYRTPGVINGRVAWSPVARYPGSALAEPLDLTGNYFLPSGYLLTLHGSLATDGSYLYVGGSQGRIYRAPLP